MLPFSHLGSVPTLKLGDDVNHFVPFFLKDGEYGNDDDARYDPRHIPEPGLFEIDCGIPDDGHQ